MVVISFSVHETGSVVSVLSSLVVEIGWGFVEELDVLVDVVANGVDVSGRVLAAIVVVGGGAEVDGLVVRTVVRTVVIGSAAGVMIRFSEMFLSKMFVASLADTELACEWVD
jgi:hypothetical protein